MWCGVDVLPARACSSRVTSAARALPQAMLYRSHLYTCIGARPTSPRCVDREGARRESAPHVDRVWAGLRVSCRVCAVRGVPVLAAPRAPGVRVVSTARSTLQRSAPARVSRRVRRLERRIRSSRVYTITYGRQPYNRDDSINYRTNIEKTRLRLATATPVLRAAPTDAPRRTRDTQRRLFCCALRVCAYNILITRSPHKFHRGSMLQSSSEWRALGKPVSTIGCIGSVA